MNRLCTYIVSHDQGLSPNPFWGWCTLAVCTPNYMGVKLEPGDWIAGFRPKSEGHRFLYGMRVSEVLDLDDYFKDSRFSIKKPILKGNLKQRRGDNFYSLNPDGSWKQHPNRYHNTADHFRKDTRFHRVYIAEHFFYRGNNASITPEEYKILIPGRGVKASHAPELANQFVAWIEREFRAEPGEQGIPIGMDNRHS